MPASKNEKREKERYILPFKGHVSDTMHISSVYISLARRHHMAMASRPLGSLENGTITPVAMCLHVNTECYYCRNVKDRGVYHSFIK